eukprot:GHVR01046937.1.p4 GENE.GHVR01046937.1~~GHVR01046937.1.p4  ORF type:complete len:135 (+),score=7.05 GHVR01046937.1:3692-4096(+)
MAMLLGSTPRDGAKCAMVVRELIELSSNKDESAKYFDEAYNLIKEQAQQPSNAGSVQCSPQWPVDEISWLLSTAWNTGVRFYKMHNFEASEKWLSRGLKYLAVCPNQSHFKEQMSDLYAICLTKLENRKIISYA